MGQRRMLIAGQENNSQGRAVTDNRSIGWRRGGGEDGGEERSMIHPLMCSLDLLE
jgi:hypothetical protein